MVDPSIYGGNSFFYPVKGNTYLCYKPLEKTDRDKLREGFQRLSSKSVYHRFFGFLKELTDDQVTELLDTDNRDHVAWAGFDFDGEENFGVGVGRFKRSSSKPNEAELALTVIDDYQNIGVGTTLLGIMYYLGGMVGIETFTGIILADNAKLIQRFSELGAVMQRLGHEYEMRLPVYQDFELLPKTRYSTMLMPVLHFLKENNFCY